MSTESAHLFGVLGIIHVLNGLLLKPNHHSMIAVSANTKKAKQQKNKQLRPTRKRQNSRQISSYGQMSSYGQNFKNNIYI